MTRMAVAATGGFELAEVGSIERQIIEATEVCVAANGWSKTTMDDVARESNLSRATIYRVFPGGRDVVLGALRRHSVLRFFHELRPHLVEATSAVELLSTTISAAAIQLDDDEQFQYHLEHEPGEVLSTLSFEGLDRILAVARVFIGPHLMRFMSRREAGRAAEWATRIVVTYVLEPSPWLDLTDVPAVENFVSEHLTLKLKPATH